MLSVVPLSRPLDPLWTSFVLWFFSVWLQVLLVYFTPTYVFSYFWLKINSILSVSSCVTSYSLQWILKINSISVLLVLLPCFSHCFKFLSSLSDFKHYPLHEVTVDLFFFSVFFHFMQWPYAAEASRLLAHMVQWPLSHILHNTVAFQYIIMSSVQ